MGRCIDFNFQNGTSIVITVTIAVTKGLLSAREAGTETVKIFISLWKSIKGTMPRV